HLRLRYFSLRSCCCRLRRLLRFPSRDFLGFSDFGHVGVNRQSSIVPLSWSAICSLASLARGSYSMAMRRIMVRSFVSHLVGNRASFLCNAEGPHTNFLDGIPKT